MDLGITIKELRKQKGITQSLLAEKSGITQTYLSQIESNDKEPNLSTLRVISEKLDVPLPIIFFLSLDEKDIKPDKFLAYTHLAPSIKAMIKELYVNPAGND